MPSTAAPKGKGWRDMDPVIARQGACARGLLSHSRAAAAAGGQDVRGRGGGRRRAGAGGRGRGKSSSFPEPSNHMAAGGRP